MKMKRVLLSAVLSCTLVLSAHAQTREINFKHDAAFKEVLAEAKKQNKLIFFDAYTSWCGPCKVMASTVFKTDSVADFFNQTFVNLKVDMEKGEGPDLNKRFEVSAYPTLLFIDGDGNLVHKIVGSAPANEFMAESRKALDPTRTVYGLGKKFNAGDHSDETTIAYMTALEAAYEQDKMGEVAGIYFDALPQSSLLGGKNWTMAKRFLFDVSSSSFAYLLNNSEVLASKYGKGKVEMYFNQVFYNAISSIKKTYSTNVAAAGKKAKVMEDLLKTGKVPSSEDMLVSLELTKLSGTKQWDKYCTTLENKAHQPTRPSAYTVLWPAMEMVRDAPVKYSSNALKLADYYSDDKNNLNTQILVSDLRKMANKKQGKIKEAEAFALNSDNLRKEAAAKGRGTPQIMKD
uniref:thioredoxin family protein n=1 Tax=Pedobacter schmidteae TaxID=2201271 RepID=UPI000EB062F0|nr:thioredoxin family protein [Pedobacter schmidteae]